MSAPGGHGLAPGVPLAGFDRVVTEARLRWYGDALLSASADEPRQVGANIHTDDEDARREGLPAAIADGMLGTNWIAELLLDGFGEHALTSSRLRTKFIRPVVRGARLSVRGLVTGLEERGAATTYHLDVWISDETGTKVTVGEASVTVPAGAGE